MLYLLEPIRTLISTGYFNVQNLAMGSV